MPVKKKAAGFNLAQLDTYSKSASGIDVPIKHPVTGEVIGEKGSELTIKVLGPASRQYRDAQNQLVKKLIRQGRAEKEGVAEIVEDNYEDDNLNIVLACVCGWSNLYFDPDGGEDTETELEFNPMNVEMVMINCPWIRRQLEAKIGSEANFMKGSQSS